MSLYHISKIYCENHAQKVKRREKVTSAHQLKFRIMDKQLESIHPFPSVNTNH